MKLLAPASVLAVQHSSDILLPAPTQYVTDSSEDLLKAAEEVLRQRAAAGQQAVAEAAAAAGVTWDTEAVSALPLAWNGVGNFEAPGQ